MATGGRKTQYAAIHQISQAFDVAATGVPPASVILGVLPAGAILGTLHLQVPQVFNSTTNTVAVGTTPGGTQLLAATDLKTGARTDTPAPAAAAGPLGSDTPIYLTFASTGAAPTQGRAAVWLDYLPGPG
jgi:hypothetical protein